MNRSIGRIVVIGLGLCFLSSIIAAQPSQANKDSTDSVALLLKRVDTDQRLFIDRRFAEAYELLASKHRAGTKDKREWIKSVKKWGRRIRVKEWYVVSVSLAGNQAKVKLLISGESKTGRFGWEQIQEEATAFWVLENGNWYRNIFQPEDWNDADAQEIPLPEHMERPKYVDIKSKN